MFIQNSGLQNSFILAESTRKLAFFISSLTKVFQLLLLRDELFVTDFHRFNVHFSSERQDTLSVKINRNSAEGDLFICL